MSVFHGPQGKGAMAAHRKRKRMRAYDRNTVACAKPWPCGHTHGAVVCDTSANNAADRAT